MSKHNYLDMHYWKNEYESEVDFILQKEKGETMLVEVKSKKGKVRSLANYIKEYNPISAIKITASNFGLANRIKTIRLYAVFYLTKDKL